MAATAFDGNAKCKIGVRVGNRDSVKAVGCTRGYRDCHGGARVVVAGVMDCAGGLRGGGVAGGGECSS